MNSNVCKPIQQRLLQFVTVIPLDNAVLSTLSLYETQFRTPQDAVVYASVLDHLRTAPAQLHCFLNRNKNDFSAPDVETALTQYDCKIIFSFKQGLSYIQSQL